MDTEFLPFPSFFLLGEREREIYECRLWNRRIYEGFLIETYYLISQDSVGFCRETEVSNKFLGRARYLGHYRTIFSHA